MSAQRFSRTLTPFCLILSALAIQAGDLKIHVINVGWSESVLVEGPEVGGVKKTLLIDTGLQGKTKSMVIPYLQKNITKLDYFVLSHNHADHGGGAADLVKAFPPSASYYCGSTMNTGAAFMKSWFAAYTTVGKPAPASITPGQVIDLGDGATATCIVSNGQVLNQAAVVAKLQETNPGYALPVPDEPNGTSIVLLVKYKGFDYLYMGDLDGQGDMDFETPTIQSILLADQTTVKTPAKGIDVLQVGHHGSKTATNPLFVDLAGPEVALVSVGPNQPHGLPNKEAIDDVLLAKNVKVLQTDEGDLSDARATTSGWSVGDIEIHTDGTTYTITSDPTTIDYAGQLAKSGQNTQSEEGVAKLPWSLKVDSMPVDGQAPVVSVSTLGNAGTISLIANTTDNVGAIAATFLIDNKSVGTASSAPSQSARFMYAFDSKTVENGNHSLVVKAADAAGNIGTSPALSFPVSNPVVDTVAPTVKTSVTGTNGSIQLQAATTDNVGAVKAVFFVDGQTVGTITAVAATSQAFSLPLDSKTLVNGSHTLVVKASDAAGNEGASVSLSFPVNNPVLPTTFTEFESNNSLTSANPVGDQVTKITGFLSSASDADDYFALSIPAGRTLTLDMVGPTASSQNYDLYLYSAANKVLAKSVGTSTTEHLTYRNAGTRALKVYIDIRRINSYSRVTPYSLTLTR